MSVLSSSFSVSSELSGGACVVVLDGELDLATASRAREEISARLARSSVVVDLSGVTFMDCAGLQALVASRRRAVLTGEHLCFAAPSRPVARLLALTGLQQVLEVFPTVARAMAAVGATGRVVEQCATNCSPSLAATGPMPGVLPATRVAAQEETLAPGSPGRI